MVTMVNIPGTAAAGDIVEVKILISHPMETGFRTGPDGALVPRNIIHDFRCLYGGEEIFRAEIFPPLRRILSSASFFAPTGLPKSSFSGPTRPGRSTARAGC